MNTFPPGGINLNGSLPAHRRVPVGHAGQERMSPLTRERPLGSSPLKPKKPKTN
jgi:hypothetical protein